MKIPETKKSRVASLSGWLPLRKRTAKCHKHAGWRGRCAATQPGPCWVFPGWIRLLSTKQSEQEEIIRLDNSNSRVTGSLQERQKGMRAKKKETQFRNLATSASLGNELQTLSRVLERPSPRRSRVRVD